MNHMFRLLALASALFIAGLLCLSMEPTRVRAYTTTINWNVTSAATACRDATGPPPEAVRAGYTSMLFCWDSSNPAYAAGAHTWLNCDNTVLPTTVWASDLSYFSPVSCDPYWTQVSDTDGGNAVTVERFVSNPALLHGDVCRCFIMATLGSGPVLGGRLPVTTDNPNGTRDFPASSVEIEVRFRMKQFAPSGSNVSDVPTVFDWSTIMSLTSGSGGTETDYLEAYGGIGWDQAMHGYGSISQNGSWISYRGASAPPPDLLNYHTYSVMKTTDGNQTIQFCGYIDHVLSYNQYPALGQSDPSVAKPCLQTVFPPQMLFMRNYLTNWFGDPQVTYDEEYFIERYTVWGPPNANQFRINSPFPSDTYVAPNTVGFDTQIPACASSHGCQLTQ